MTIENPPAFPRTGEGVGNPNYDEPGMLLRDWFAGQALASVLDAMRREHAFDPERSLRLAAVGAYVVADAMLLARKAAP